MRVIARLTEEELEEFNEAERAADHLRDAYELGIRALMDNFAENAAILQAQQLDLWRKLGETYGFTPGNATMIDKDTCEIKQITVPDSPTVQ